MTRSRVLFMIFAAIMIQPSLSCTREKNHGTHQNSPNLRQRNLLKPPKQIIDLTKQSALNRPFCAQEWFCAMTLLELSVGISTLKSPKILDLTLAPLTIHPNPTDRKKPRYLAINDLLSQKSTSIRRLRLNNQETPKSTIVNQS